MYGGVSGREVQREENDTKEIKEKLSLMAVQDRSKGEGAVCGSQVKIL